MWKRLAGGALIFLPLGCGHLGVSRLDLPDGAIGTWETVKALGAGQRVEVETWAGVRIVGDLGAVSEHSLVVRTSRDEHVRRTAIRVVAVPAGRETGTRARRGLGIGAAAGALLNAVTTRGHPVWLLLGALGGGILGTAFGAIDGATTVRLEVVYLASGPAPTAARAPERGHAAHRQGSAAGY